MLKPLTVISQNGNMQRRKKKFPTLFCRPGIPVVDKKQLVKDVELAVSMASLNLDNDVHESFEDMGLQNDILKGIHAYGLEKPAYIQQRAILPCIKGKDAIVQAQSGMGKTAALVIAILQRIDRSISKCQAIILAPTRELAEQIFGVVQKLSSFMTPKVTSYLCAGGRASRSCKTAMLSGPHIVVGTVGRTLHMLLGDGNLNQGAFLDPSHVKTFALDEADQLLQNNFGADLTYILEKIPESSQVIIMSATMPGNILKLAWLFMKNPLTILVRDFQLTLDGIQQYYVDVGDESAKVETLLDLYPIIEKERGMIFCNTKKRVEAVIMKMRERSFNVAHINGNMVQEERDEIMYNFRKGEEGYRVIITSDLLGRGIDVQQINLVVNFDLPDHKETYIHRVGRAGRYGRKGVALSFVSGKDVLLGKFKEITEFYETVIPPMPPPKDFSKILKNTVCNEITKVIIR